MYNIDFSGAPKDTFENILNRYQRTISQKGKKKEVLETVLCLDDVLASEQSITVIFQDLLDLMKYGFEDENIRHLPIHFKIHKGDEKVHTLAANNFISNLIFWDPFVKLDVVDMMDETYIMNFVDTSQKDYMEYMNTKILPFMDDVEWNTRNAMIDDITYHMKGIAFSFTMLMGLGMSIYDIHKMGKKFPEIEEIMSKPIDRSMQPAEIEDDLTARTKRIVQIFSSTPNDIWPLFKSGSGLSEVQFKEIVVRIGFKADINGTTIPYPIDCNLLWSGINKPSYYYILGTAGRKSLIVGKNRMSEPGYLSKKMNNTALQIVLRSDNETCGSSRYVEYHIKDDMMLKMLDRRYYVWKGELKLLNYREDKHLIGKHVSFRSPCTCLSAHKDGVCKTCYGTLHEINKDLSSAGGFAATKNSEPIGQNFLSTKHKQTTASQLINLCKEFHEAFELNSATVTIATNASEQYAIQIEGLEMEHVGEQVKYYCTDFALYATSSESKFKIFEENGAKFYLSEKLLKMHQRSKGKPIDLLDFDDEEALFYLEVQSDDVTNMLAQLEKVLNSKDHNGATTISELCQEYLETNLHFGIKNNAVHNEMVIASLLRDPHNTCQYVDFETSGDYQLMTIDSSLKSNPSPTLSLQTGYLRQQLTSADFLEKRRPSYIDAMYMPYIDLIERKK